MTPSASAPKHIFIVAGEASGDQHAAVLVKKLMHEYPGRYQFSALGGACLQAIPEVTLIEDIASRGITGFVEVIQQIPYLKGLFHRTVQAIQQLQPDLIILIDYPGFNLRLARLIKQCTHIRILYYISPQIWAWKAKRIQTLKKYVDHMAVILPFEREIFQKENIPCTYVGHPLVEHLIQISPKEAKQQLGLSSKAPVIALLPGSRRSELKHHLPILLEAVAQLRQQEPDLQFIMPIAPTIDDACLHTFLKHPHALQWTRQPAQLVMQSADLVLVASGTASLEAALLNKPIAVFYKTSRINTIIAAFVIRVRYIALCNLIMNRMMVPEFLQDDFTAEHITEQVLKMLHHPTYSSTMSRELGKLKQLLAQDTTEKSLTTMINNII